MESLDENSSQFRTALSLSLFHTHKSVRNGGGESCFRRRVLRSEERGGRRRGGTGREETTAL